MWIANAIASYSRLSQNLLNPLWVARKPIFWLVSPAQHLQDPFPLLRWAEREINTANACEQPVYLGPNFSGDIGMNDEGTQRAAAFAPLHVIFGRHEQVGWPFHLLA
jgi:hypothetical protein